MLFICFSQWRPVEIVSVLLGGFSSKTENQLWDFSTWSKENPKDEDKPLSLVEIKMINELKVN